MAYNLIVLFFKIIRSGRLIIIMERKLRVGVLINTIYSDYSSTFLSGIDKFCKDNNLICMAGSDYHHDYQDIATGIYVPKEIETEKQLLDYIFNNKIEIITNANAK